MISVSSRWTLSGLCLLSFLSLAASQNKYIIDAKVSFYVDITMTCDHHDLNITKMADIQSLSWILPSGITIDSDSYLDPSLYTLTGPPADMQVAGDRSSFDGYNLTAYEIDEDVFGYYSCIIVYTSPTKPISVVRWGLNVNGASFDELMEVYEKGAIVGGVAAAVFFVLVVGTCIVWHYCFAERPEISEDGDIEVEKRGNDVIQEKEHVYNNKAYSGDAAPSDVDVSVDSGPGKNGLNTKM